MEKMRCHKSSIVIKSMHQMSFWFLALLYFLISKMKSESMEITVNNKVLSPVISLLIAVILYIIIFLILLIFNYIRWRKTLLYIEQENFVEEKNFIMRRTKTVKLSSIATVNLQQNLLERIFRVYHLKFDINSSATANETDFDLIFDKQTALYLKKQLLQETESSDVELQGDVTQNWQHTEEVSISFGFFEVIRHSVFCLSVGTIVLFLISIGFVILSMLEELASADGDVALSFLVMAVPAVWSVIKRFIDYQGYTFTKCGDKYHLQYGLLTKHEYDLNRSRASAIVIKQPFIARMFGYCYGEFVNVGLGDETNNTESPVFCLCVKKEKLYQLLGEILPDYEPEAPVTNMSAKSQFLISPFGIGFFIVVPVGMVLAGLPAWVLLIFPAYLALALLVRFLAIRTSGIGIQSEYATIINGSFDKTTYITQFSKIQNIQVRDSIITKRLSIARGNVWILASMTKSVISLPYVERACMDELAAEMLGHENRLRL